MDIHGLIDLLKRIESRTVRCIGLDLPEPSPLAHEILNAKPYAFLDNAPLEERKTQAVYTRRAGDPSADGGLGVLDLAAIKKVCEEAWPRATNPDELHEALLLVGALTEIEAGNLADHSAAWLELLSAEGRAGKLASAPVFWVAAERWSMIQAIYPGCDIKPPLVVPQSEREASVGTCRCRAGVGSGANGSCGSDHG